MLGEPGIDASRDTILFGPGPRPLRLGAVLAALSGAREAESAGSADWATIRERIAAFRARELADVEELLIDPGGRRVEPPGTGTLILEGASVPTEDIGFVRRFLERHHGWALWILGEDRREAGAAGLLELPRARWLAWPPDLEQVGGLLGQDAPAGRPAAPRPAAEGRGPEPEAPRGAPLDAVLQEFLTGMALAGEGAPKIRYHRSPALRVDLDRAGLRRSLEGLFALALRCADHGGLVEVAPEPAEGGAARVEVRFPVGPLTDGDLPGLLDGGFEGDPELEADVDAARASAHELRDQGGDVSLEGAQPGRLRLWILLPSGSSAPPGEGAEAPAASLGAPETA